MTNNTADTTGHAEFDTAERIQTFLDENPPRPTPSPGNAQGNGLHGQMRAVVTPLRRFLQVECEPEKAPDYVLVNGRKFVPESEVEAEREKVTALSQPRIFNAAGLVDADLAERYESLRTAFDIAKSAHESAATMIAEQSQRIADLETALGLMTDERDNAIEARDAADAVCDQLRQDLATERSFSDGLAAERDAASALARRYRDERGIYTTAEVSLAADRIAQTIAIQGMTSFGDLASAGDRTRRTLAETAFRELGLRKRYEGERPRVTVVTSPRFYSEEQGMKAATILRQSAPEQLGSMHGAFLVAMVDCVAMALGMRRAAK
jgi:hypothetical protein